MSKRGCRHPKSERQLLNHAAWDCCYDCSICRLCSEWFPLGPATPPPADEMRLAAGLADIAVLMEPCAERTRQEQRFVEWFAGWRK